MSPRALIHWHSNYYNDLVAFKVEDEVYCVPKRGFAQYSEVFESMFSLPQPEGSGEGMSVEHPIILPSCSKWEFETLLDVLYPMAPLLQPVPLWKEQWLCLLRLSNMWAMDKIRQLAIGEIIKIRSITAIDFVLLAREHQVPQWLTHGYSRILEEWQYRGPQFAEDLKEKLGKETLTRLRVLRSRVTRHDHLRPFAPPFLTVHGEALSRAIETEFRRELASMS
ncbi:hypothetical protein NMY22_g7574 [Coprinellus aureogranulatus]|nr:hypothetical protein NMY22_g7574 [Coprinellus aureogranulatus]